MLNSYIDYANLIEIEIEFETKYQAVHLFYLNTYQIDTPSVIFRK